MNPVTPRQPAQPPVAEDTGPYIHPSIRPEIDLLDASAQAALDVIRGTYEGSEARNHLMAARTLQGAASGRLKARLSMRRLVSIEAQLIEAAHTGETK